MVKTGRGRFACLVAAVTLAGCFRHHVAEEADVSEETDAGRERDAVPSTRPGPPPDCDDPGLWRAKPDERASISTDRCCECGSRENHPVVPVDADVDLPDASLRRFSGFCWRVIEAAEGSGWEAGDRLAEMGADLDLRLRGHDRSIRLEARSRDASGGVLVARSAPFSVPRPALKRESVEDFVRILYDHGPDAGIARGYSVDVGDRSLTTEGRVLDARQGMWLEDVDGTLVLRWMPEGADSPRSRTLDGPPAGARLLGVRTHLIVATDERAWFFAYGERLEPAGGVTFDAPPDDLTTIDPVLVVQVDRRLRAWRVPEAEPVDVTLGPVDELVDGYVRMGKRLIRLRPSEGRLELRDSVAVELTNAEHETLGELLAVADAGVWGEGGFRWAGRRGGARGPRVASAEKLYGGRILDVYSRAFMGDVFAVRTGENRASIFFAWTITPCE